MNYEPTESVHCANEMNAINTMNQIWGTANQKGITKNTEIIGTPSQIAKANCKILATENK